MHKDLQKYKEIKEKFNQPLTVSEEIAYLDGYEDGYEAGKLAGKLELEREMSLILKPCVGEMQ